MLLDVAGRESYGAAAEKLEASVRGATPEALAATAEELLAVAGLLAAEPRLRRALSDPARSGADRIGLLRELLRGRAGEQAIELAATLVGGRWSGPGELRDAAERLGVEALLAGGEAAGELAEVEDELFRFGQVVDGSPQLAATVGDASVDPERRAELIADLLRGKARPNTVRLAQLAVQGFGGRSFFAALTRLVELTARRRERSVAYVTVAAPLTDAEERRLADALSQLYGQEVSVLLTVDPEVLGGISVQIGSDLYDGTVLRRLVEARNALASG